MLPQQRAVVIFKLFSASHFSPKGFSKILIEIQCLIKRNRLWNFLVRSFLTMTRSFHADSFEASSLWRLSGICWRGFSPIGPLQLTSTTGRHKGFDEQSMNPLTGSSKIQSQTAWRNSPINKRANIREKRPGRAQMSYQVRVMRFSLEISIESEWWEMENARPCSCSTPAKEKVAQGDCPIYAPLKYNQGALAQGCQMDKFQSTQANLQRLPSRKPRRTQ